MSQHSNTIDSANVPVAAAAAAFLANANNAAGTISAPGGSILGLPLTGPPVGLAAGPSQPSDNHDAIAGALYSQWRQQFDLRQNELLHEYLERKLRLDAQQEHERQQLNYLVELWHRQQDYVEREQRKREELETLRNKTASQHSANASPVVKECLHDFLKNKMVRRQTAPLTAGAAKVANGGKASTSSAPDPDSPHVSTERLMTPSQNSPAHPSTSHIPVSPSASQGAHPSMSTGRMGLGFDGSTLRKYPSEPSLKAPSPLRSRLFSGRESPLHSNSQASPIVPSSSMGFPTKRRAAASSNAAPSRRAASRSDSVPGSSGYSSPMCGGSRPESPNHAVAELPPALLPGQVFPPIPPPPTNMAAGLPQPSSNDAIAQMLAQPSSARPPVVHSTSLPAATTANSPWPFPLAALVNEFQQQQQQSQLTSLFSAPQFKTFQNYIPPSASTPISTNEDSFQEVDSQYMHDRYSSHATSLPSGADRLIAERVSNQTKQRRLHSSYGSNTPPSTHRLHHGRKAMSMSDDGDRYRYHQSADMADSMSSTDQDPDKMPEPETDVTPMEVVHGSGDLPTERSDRKLSVVGPLISFPSRGRQLPRSVSDPVLDAPQILGLAPSGEGSSRTGIAYNELTLKHQCVCGRWHPENSNRTQSIWTRLSDRGLLSKCVSIPGRLATTAELLLAHPESHVNFYGKGNSTGGKLNSPPCGASGSPKSESPVLQPMPSVFSLPCGGIGVDADTYWNPVQTALAAKAAVGSVVDLSMLVAQDELQNGFALVRPPGHHAEPNRPMGFCFFNNIVIAAKSIVSRGHAERVAILDWDIHHGNGTQFAFYDSPEVLYISMHRYENGNFFPGTGAPEDVGSGKGTGFTVNVGFSSDLNPPMEDIDYLIGFHSVVLPILRDYRPQVILVSAGFDATSGHQAPLGGYNVSAACFGHMVQALMNEADGRLVLVLEGGYDLETLCDSAESCTMALLGHNPFPFESLAALNRPACVPAQESLRRVVEALWPYWRGCLQDTTRWIGMPALDVMKLSCPSVKVVTP